MHMVNKPALHLNVGLFEYWDEVQTVVRGLQTDIHYFTKLE